MIRLDDVSIKRSGLTVCPNLTLEAQSGEITVVLGANGAGKTTLLDGIMGLTQISDGSITFDGKSISRLATHRRSSLGIGYIDQARSLFSRLTVAQNIAVVDRSPAALERAFAQFPRLRDRIHTRAGMLSGGEQQMLLIARALTAHPRMLLVDELSLGLAPNIVQELMQHMRQLADSGIGVLLVEQYADMALSIGDTAYVIEQGKIVTSGSAADLRRNRSRIESAYLGGDV